MVAYLNDGKVYQWVSIPYSVPFDVPFIMPSPVDSNDKVIKLVCGKSHCVALCDNGLVYTWGSNEKGQLGYKILAQRPAQGVESYLLPTSANIVANRMARTLSLPKRVTQLIEEKFVIDISCGAEFSVVVLEDGSVISWGSINECFQLGVKANNRDWMFPIEVVFPDKVEIRKIACGPAHVLALTKTGELYVWGDNSLSQLGVSKYEGKVQKLMTYRKFVDIAASYLSQLSVAVSDSNEILIWGQCASGIVFKIPTVSRCESIHEVFCHFVHFMHEPLVCQAGKQDSILETLKREFGNPENSDLTIKVENKEIFVHKAILKLRSKYFKAMLARWLKDDEKNVTFEEKNYASVEAYLRYLYTEELQVDLILAVDLLRLADEYCDKSFKNLCEQNIKRNMTADQIAHVYAELRILEVSEDLSRFCLEFALNHADEIIQSDGYKNWELETYKAFFPEYLKRKLEVIS